MSDQSRVTLRQLEVLAAIKTFVAAHGYPPTHRELRTLLKVSSTNTVVCLLAALTLKGCLLITPSASRGMKITEAGHTLLGGTP